MTRNVPVLIVLLIIIEISLVNAAAIMCKFMTDEFNRYTAVIADQSFNSGDPSPKVYGRHLAGKKNSDVRVIDCAYKNNTFEVFPATLTQIFPNTEVLMLQDSGLVELKYESFKFTPLIKIMMFGKDDFTIEPSVFKGSVSLEVLKFEEIDFSHVQAEAFDGTDDLKILSFKNCKFNELNFNFLEPISSITEFYITQSSITRPPLKAIQNMPLLKILDLSGNKLTYLHNDLVENKHFLDLLDLSENEIIEIQRTLLEIWPNNAALNLQGNKCINKNFGHLGTSDLPLFDVVVHFMDCFHHSEDEENKRSESEEEESISKSEEKTSQNEKGGGSVSDESISIEKKASKKDNISKEFDDGKLNALKVKEEEVTDVEFHGTDSPFEFANKTNASEEESSEEEESESDEIVTTEATTTTILETTTEILTTGEAKTKKKKKKKSKKNVQTTALPATAEVLTTQDNIPNTEVTGATEHQEEIKEFVTPSYLHPYEQASCRFFIDADKGYNCVLENVTSDLKRINVDHIDGFDNVNVTGLFLRDSTLIKIPHILFTSFENLLHLSIEDTNIKQLDDDTLKEGCGKLKTLILKRNRIRVVESESLKTCIALELIDISENPVERIEGGIFECNPRLNILVGLLKITAAHLKK